MKNNIVFLDVTQNYGIGFSAANTKIGFVAKGLTLLGDNCTIHNGLVGTPLVDRMTVVQQKEVGTIVTFRQKGHPLISWIRNLSQLNKDLKQLYDKEKTNTVVLGYNDYHLFLVYVLLSKFRGYQISSLAHEWVPCVSSVPWYKKPSTWIYSMTFGYFSDTILPISEYIIKKIKHFKKPFYKLPILGEYEDLVPVHVADKKSYFVYCGASDYYRVIIVLMDSMRLLCERHNKELKLILVLGGTQKGITKVKDYIRQFNLGGFVDIMQKIEYNELLDLYRYAQALLIPLDPNNEQDHARFSQKIAEYLSTGTPVITNSVGEIPVYFTDKKNIICCDYSSSGFADAILWVAENTEIASDIGNNGYYLGKSSFNYKTHGVGLHQFFDRII